MLEKNNEILVSIDEELKKSYLDYAMSVIVGRALPDVCDGLKPVHRRILYAMNQLKNDWNKPFKKSARIVGDVIGKYHPHGDSAVYDAIVRMAQNFSMRYVMVDGQGNFGSIDGDMPAAMRYTEIRMSKLSHYLLDDLEKNTVEFVNNYDETELMPSVMPAKFPNLLVNGAAGIAVGIATNIPPHNIGEVINASIALIDNYDISINDLISFLPGPDFPTYGIINGKGGIYDAYKTGKGKIYIRAKAHFEENNNRDIIIITELPYQVNKAHLIEKIAELSRLKKVEGIHNLRDESDKDGMRIVIELKKGENKEVLLNSLFAYTQMQNVFGINMVALHNGQPKLLNLKEILLAFINHRQNVVRNRIKFDLYKLVSRLSILEGLLIALNNIDITINLIKSATSTADAKSKLIANEWNKLDSLNSLIKIKNNIFENLLKDNINIEYICGSEICSALGIKNNMLGYNERYILSEKQVQSILDIKLYNLTSLEIQKISSEYKNSLISISNFMELLINKDKLMEYIKNELIDIKSKFSDSRRTEIIDCKKDLSNEDLISDEEMLVTLSVYGYIKAQPISIYNAQKRGGKGKIATLVKDKDFINHIVIANSHDYILCFSNLGRLYWLKTYLLPTATTRQSKGKPINNLLPLSENEKINAILPIKEFLKDKFVFLTTAKGIVKKISLDNLSKPRNSGIIILGLYKDDYLVSVEVTGGDKDIIIFTNSGKAIRFNHNEIRATGRGAKGVRGIKLKENQFVVSSIINRNDGNIIIATENGYGKQTKFSAFRITKRGGVGITSIQTVKRNGNVVCATQVNNNDDLMLISNKGTLVRIKISSIPVIGRNTKGVKLINLVNDENLISIGRILNE